MQILVSTIHTEINIPNDIDDPESGTSIGYAPRLNEVIEKIADSVTAEVVGEDIVRGDAIILGGALRMKIVEVDSVPSNFKPNAFTYDGTSWAANDYYTLLTREGARHKRDREAGLIP